MNFAVQTTPVDNVIPDPATTLLIAGAAEAATRQTAAPASVLIVADKAAVTDDLRLDRAVQCADTEDAWRMLNDGQSEFSCVIVALADHEDCLAYCCRLRARLRTMGVPVIALVNDEEAAIEALAAGANDYCLRANAAREMNARVMNCLRTHLTAHQLVLQLSERQKELERQKRLTEKIIDSLPVSLYVVDRRLRIVAWNRNRETGEQGIERRQAIGRSVLDVFARMPRERFEKEFVRVFADGAPLRFEQESKADGTSRHWLISKIPMRLDEEGGEVTHVITLGEEITEQKKMNEAILHAEKLTGIGRLASGVVHEINNPLATIAACSEALQCRLEETSSLPEATQEDFREYLKIIHDESFRCKTITNSLLEFSRQRQAEKSPLQLNHLVEQTLQLVRHHPKLKRMRLSTDLGEGLAPVSANEAQIKQVFIALVTNACDATAEDDGELVIRTGWREANGARFVSAEFTDNGGGIAAENLPKIFEPFFTTKPFGQGTGLGLAVCYGIVSDHGGRIEVESEVGSGTTMRVLLPPSLREGTRI
jgi:two-component system, NtrC family, sensor kinase